jgi:hypothetical protein
VKARKASGQVTDCPATYPAPDSAVAARIGRNATTSKPARQHKPFAVARAPPLDPLAGLEHIGSLVVLGVDSTGKRTLTRCSCGAVREISTESLRTGERRSCGACGGGGRL